MILQNKNLSKLNTFGVSASASHYCLVDSMDTLCAALARRDLPAQRMVLGGGSNLLLTRDIEALVLHIDLRGKRILAQDSATTLVECAAGENWHQFVLWCLEQGLAGLENLSLIPGLVGASPIQNIGAYGVEMMNLFHALTAVDLASGEPRSFDKTECGFAYRDSVFKHELKHRYAITNVTFRLPREAELHLDYGEIRSELARMNVAAPAARDVSEAVCNIRRRKLPDPAVIGNAGSFFKNPIVPTHVADALADRYPTLPRYAAGEGRSKLAAGWLIEQCGWKGKRVGQAGVHAQHALVLVNHGGASGAEILALARAIQDSVREKFALELEPEPVIV